MPLVQVHAQKKMSELVCLKRDELKRTRVFPVAEVQVMRARLLEATQAIAGDIGSSSSAQQAALLRLYCALLGLTAMQPSREETETCVQVITQGDVDVQSALCFALLCPGLADNPVHRDLMQWLSMGDHTGSEMLLLIGIHFHTKELALIADLVRATLAIHVQIHIETYAVCGRWGIVCLWESLLLLS